MRLIESHGHIVLAQRNRPFGNHFPGPAVYYVNLVFGGIVNVKTRPVGIQGHRFQGVAINLNVCELLFRGDINDAERGELLADVFSAADDIKQAVNRVVADGVRIRLQRNTLLQCISLATENFE